MPTPMSSSFPFTSNVDDASTLYAGPTPISTTLKNSLKSDEEDLLVVNDSTGAPHSGLLVIEDELIEYKSLSNIDRVCISARGVGGTTPADYPSGTTVTFYSPYGVLHAMRDAIIALENRVINLENP